MTAKTKTGKRIRTKRQVRRPQRPASVSAGKAGRLLGQFVLPLAISVCIAICLGAVGYLGYQRVSASDFFNVKRVDVVGINRASKTAIENIIKTDTERSGVWRSDLGILRSKIEAIPFVKTAAVTRVLPNGIRVQVVERQPMALAMRNGRQYLVDAEGEILAESDKPEDRLPFAMVGWDETKSEKAMKDNVERVKMYQRMLAEWRNADIVSKVRQVDIVDLRTPKAIVSDSGLSVSIAVGRESFGENLTRGIKAIVGKGNMFDGVNLIGTNMVLTPRKQN